MSGTNLLKYSRRKWRRGSYYVENTECISRLPGGLVRRSDLFGFADLVAVPDPYCDLDPAFVFLQVTSRANISTRLRKIQNGTTGKGQWERPMADIARAILVNGDRVMVEGWDQPKGPGTRWRDKERELTLEDLE